MVIGRMVSSMASEFTLQQVESQNKENGAKAKELIGSVEET